MHNARIGKTTQVALANVKTNAKKPNIATSIVPKAVARIRQDIKSWNKALQLTKLEDNPKWFLYHQLLDEIGLDALLTSQYKNRLLKALSENIILKKPNGDVDQEQTDLLNNAVFTNDINGHILDSIYKGHSLIELSFNDDERLKVDLIPRANVDPTFGAVYPDYTEDKKILYRDTAEYGTWLLEFGKPKDYGLFNNAVPHVLFKRFAQSCWSELCEIYGIPPRFMKTNTQDPTMVKRAENMMTDMGAAAWFIIDESESFEFAKGVSTSGDVYGNLITLCNNEISMLISGAVIGQDTKNGNRSKDESSQEMLQTLIESDLSLLEAYWNTSVIPALVNLGVLKGELVYAYEQTEDLEQLWKMTSEALPYYDVNPEWVKEKFGIDVLGKKEAPQQNNLNLGFDFFD
ncbi:DUF935 family protein [Formosa sp. S-31]